MNSDARTLPLTGDEIIAWFGPAPTSARYIAGFRASRGTVEASLVR
jgi:hypothetical protein